MMMGKAVVRRTADVTGVLSAIDNALAGDGDAMRWQPPQAEVAIKFTWTDKNGDEQGAVFSSVSREQLSSIGIGHVVWVNDERFAIITWVSGEMSTSFTLERLAAAPAQAQAAAVSPDFSVDEGFTAWRQL
jgi:hypothetical protein